MISTTFSRELLQGESARGFWRAHIAGWFFLAVIGFSSRAAVFGSTEAAFWLTLVLDPLAFALTSIAAVMLARHPPTLRAPFLALFCVIPLCAVSALLAGIGYGVHLLLVPGILSEVPQHQFRMAFMYYMGMLSIWSLIYFGMAAELSARTERFLKIGAETRALRLELEHLQLQIEPHFLFNSLNTIVAEIAERPAIAEEMTRRLADYLRYSLDRRGRGLCRVEEEIDAAQAYVRIVALRFDKRLECHCRIDPATLDVEIPHMTLQGLVENAIKHGMRADYENFPVTIHTRRHEDQTIIEVINPGNLRAPFGLSQGGAGLNNLCRRLELRYDGRYEFLLEQRGENIVATVKLQGVPAPL
ncbi:MAG: histidine kinase [Candidimonas sp.]